MAEKKIMTQNKEPWFAACLSWELPGAGQIYSCKFIRGVLLFLISTFSVIFFIFTVISPKYLIGVPLLIGIFGFILQIIITIDAYKIAKKSNTTEFEINRKLIKDPWLSVFLSLILPGLGHAYIRKYVHSLLYLVSFFVLEYFSAKRDLIEFFIMPLFCAWVPINAYFTTIKNWALKRNILILICIFLIFIIISALQIKFFKPFSIGKGGSMEPTLHENERVIFDVITYRLANPHIGDIVALKKPENYYSPMGYSELIKRIVAKEGETVQVIDEKIFVNGKERKFNIAKREGTLNENKVNFYGLTPVAF